MPKIQSLNRSNQTLLRVTTYFQKKKTKRTIIRNARNTSDTTSFHHAQRYDLLSLHTRKSRNGKCVNNTLSILIPSLRFFQISLSASFQTLSWDVYLIEKVVSFNLSGSNTRAMLSGCEACARPSLIYQIKRDSLGFKLNTSAFLLSFIIREIKTSQPSNDLPPHGIPFLLSSLNRISVFMSSS